MTLGDMTLGELWDSFFVKYKEENDFSGYTYFSKEVPGDKYAFDVTVVNPDGKKKREFRVLTFGEVDA